MNTAQHTTSRFAAIINFEVKYPAVTITKTRFRILLMDQRTIVLMDYTCEEFEGRYKTEQVVIAKDKDALWATESVNIYDNPIVLPSIVDQFLCSCDLMRRPELVGLKTHQNEGSEIEWFALKKENELYLSEHLIEPGTWW